MRCDVHVGYAFLSWSATPHRRPLPQLQCCRDEHMLLDGSTHVYYPAIPLFLALSTDRTTGARHWVQDHYPWYTMYIINLLSIQSAPYHYISPGLTERHKTALQPLLSVFLIVWDFLRTSIVILHVQFSSAIFFFLITSSTFSYCLSPVLNTVLPTRELCYRNTTSKQWHKCGSFLWVWICMSAYQHAYISMHYVCECVWVCVRGCWRALFEMLRKWLWRTGSFLLSATLTFSHANPALHLNGLRWTCTHANLFRLCMAEDTPHSVTCFEILAGNASGRAVQT